MRRVPTCDNSASMGINAMIVFVALVLVSAVISVVILTLGQQIFQHSEVDADKTENIVYGKIFVSSATITNIEFDANNNPRHANLKLSIELSPGAGTVEDHLVHWAVLCPTENGNQLEARWTNEGNFEAATTASGNGGDVGAIEELSVGAVYMITVALEHTTDDDNDGIMDSGGCPPNFLESHTLIIAISGSGSYTSLELNYDDSIDIGEKLI